MTHQCPACSAATRQIAVTLGRNQFPMDFMPCHPQGAKQDFWTMRIPTMGFMAAEVCSECNLVSWFFHPEAELPPEAAESAGLPVVSDAAPSLEE